MPNERRFKVTIEETNVYIIEVEAANVGLAREEAIALLENTDDTNQFFSHTESRKVTAAFPA